MPYTDGLMQERRNSSALAGIMRLIFRTDYVKGTIIMFNVGL